MDQLSDFYRCSCLMFWRAQGSSVRYQGLARSDLSQGWCITWMANPSQRQDLALAKNFDISFKFNDLRWVRMEHQDLAKCDLDQFRALCGGRITLGTAWYGLRFAHLVVFLAVRPPARAMVLVCPAAVREYGEMVSAGVRQDG